MADEAKASEQKKNQYTCEMCGGVVVTIDLDEGVTPFMIGCQASKTCKGMMTSAFYRVDNPEDPSWEWYRPDVTEARQLNDGMLDHVLRGGLLLRRRQAVIHL